jgi:O-antigen/teichoic acid export membrane protein
LAVVAPELVSALLGRQWHGAVQPFQCLIIALPFRVASKLQGTVLRSLGRVYVQAGREWNCALWLALAAYGGAKLAGVNGLSLGVMIALLLNYLVGALSVRRVSGLSVASQSRCMWRPVVWSVVIFGAIGLFRGVLTSAVGVNTAGMVSLMLVIVAFFLMISLAPKLYGRNGDLLLALAKDRIAKSRRR